MVSPCQQTHVVTELRGDVRYALPVKAPVFVKTGFNWRDQFVGTDSASRRWSYTGTTALPKVDTVVPMDRIKTGRQLPVWEASHFQPQLALPAFQHTAAHHYASTFLTSYTAANLGRNLYRVERKLVNLGFSYQVRPWVNLTLDIDNLTNVPQIRYRGVPDQVQYYNYPGTTITVGVNGRF